MNRLSDLLEVINMSERKTARRYIYEDTTKEIIEWAEQMIREQRLQKRSPNNKINFPFYLEQYLTHLKFQARKG